VIILTNFSVDDRSFGGPC